MPLHNTGHLEHAIESGHITISTGSKTPLPAYWAHPRLGNQKFPALVLIHDWWGMKNNIRLLVHYFASCGYYVIAPDLYERREATTPAQALELLEATKDTRYDNVSATLTVLEGHHRTNRRVATLGIGMGGTLAYEAAIKRDDLEVAIAWGGFPQQFLGQFHQSNTPILALYGEHEPFTKPVVIDALRDELAQTPLGNKHRVERIPNAKHEFFVENPTPEERDIGQEVIKRTMAFLDQFIEKPKRKPIF